MTPNPKEEGEMEVEGGCYCGEVRYRATGEPTMKAQCFCRECQTFTGGDSMLGLGMPPEGFELTKGELKDFQRSDLENAVTRQFCPNCGTHVASRPMPGMLILKIGTLDDPSVFEGPQMAIFTCDAQTYHRLPTDVPTFERVPG